jgi:hypothetical protein
MNEIRKTGDYESLDDLKRRIWRRYGLRDRRAMLAADPVLNFLAAPGSKPTVGWYIEEAVTVDHLASRFGKRGDAELHSTRNAASIPGCLLPAAVFLPDSHPGEVFALPYVAESQLILRRIGNEIGVLTHRVGQMRRVSTGRCGRLHFGKGRRCRHLCEGHGANQTQSPF